MATIGLFISPSEIKAKTFLDENIDEKTIVNSIVYCQEEYTKAILGTALYNEIKGQIEAGTLTSDNTTLRDTYLRPALRYWVLYEGMDEFYMKATNKSIMLKKSDNSDPVDLNAILSLKSSYRNRAERHDEKTRLFLIENADTYPLYRNAGNGTDTIHPKGLTYGTDWYLGGSSDCSDIDKLEYPGSCCD